MEGLRSSKDQLVSLREELEAMRARVKTVTAQNDEMAQTCSKFDKLLAEQVAELQQLQQVNVALCLDLQRVPLLAQQVAVSRPLGRSQDSSTQTDSANVSWKNDLTHTAKGKDGHRRGNRLVRGSSDVITTRAPTFDEEEDEGTEPAALQQQDRESVACPREPKVTPIPLLIPPLPLSQLLRIDTLGRASTRVSLLAEQPPDVAGSLTLFAP
ncbi:unnamed protein product [Vitrella brassicaformis CCMP3155]|uniref:Uncharacterized protein n=1 Tax=Vitrella brassicaformis (strain CCMP3155) TaxID=1169540 RepID=A0A0G4G967_VITBC|nr:unnamed protein product [Vitrella brassicaformis CCMP3155]|eukprot:CEM25331.1 unnamed protein product [Vitrella brassicaformis CCMP3155]